MALWQGENGKGHPPDERYSQMVFGPTFLSQMTMLSLQVRLNGRFSVSDDSTVKDSGCFSVSDDL